MKIKHSFLLVAMTMIAMSPLCVIFAQAQEEGMEAIASSFAGAELTYHYAEGPLAGFRFSLMFDGKELTYQVLNLESQPISAPFPYKAREIRDEVYLIAWHQPDETYISLIIDARAMKVHNTMVWGPSQRSENPEVWGIHTAEIEEFRLTDE